MAQQWFVVHVFAGFEREIGQKIKEALEAAGLSEKVSEIVVPPEKIIEIIGLASGPVARRFYPGYLLVKAEPDEKVFEVIRSIDKVVGFMGGEKPLPLREEEAQKIIERLKVSEIKPKPRYQFQEGDRVRVTQGPFANFHGVVTEVKPDKGKVKVLVSIFGRETPVELEFAHVQKI
ncbi:transcription termination/antitermination protein NusG [Thermodesulfatator autotrophicus]|uniref:Transcription termination/antitermination protein NusG n=1 Tax=Thermodesulfatator autotrophicus TaxID=1795632 RepID=A0A177E9H8_9BACT|nr:transcription termination/antitermination protein NusG [Thermodesulfatator autotrophicus]OAG28070.1 transcription termination/antitermination protein NusG [Thermodesulfatator autotrophicus]